MLSGLNAIDGINCKVPERAFYMYPCCAGLIGRTTSEGDIIANDQQFAEYLLRAVGVAVVPGSAFGLAPYFRLSYAASTDQLDVATQHIANACVQLS